MLTIATSLALLLAAPTGLTTSQAKTAAPSAVNLSNGTNSEGTSSSFPRADHVHAVTNAATALGTCEAASEGREVWASGTGGSATSTRTRLCRCTSDGGATPVYAWLNGALVGTSTTCPASDALPPNQGAVLYASFASPGCYATGATALAVNGAGTPVAATFSRSVAAPFMDTPSGGWWRSCSANQLRVSGTWVGALLEPAATNLFATPTDSPTSSGNWSLIASGPTVTANSAGFLDNTTTATTFVESAGVVSGIQQTVSTSAGYYAMSAMFLFNNRPCWGVSLDGTTVHAKFDVQSGSVTYRASGVSAGVSHHQGGWIRAWASASIGSGSLTPQFFATAACTDSTKAATGGTATTYLARVMFENTRWASTYAAVGSARTDETLSFPVSVASGNVCISAKIEPFGSGLETRTNTPILSAFASATTYGGANQMYLYQQGATTVTCQVNDASAGARSVTSNPYAAFADRPHVFKCCTDTSGAVKLGYDGVVSQNATGAGTGILGATPTVIYAGILSTNIRNASPIAMSELTVCNTGSPDSCGNWERPSLTANAAIGDSMTVGVAGSLTSTSWTVNAASGSGTTVANIARSAWQTDHGLAAWLARPGHRYRKVAVWLGTNDLGIGGKNAGSTFDRLRQLYQAIIAEGSIPVPMTVLPRNFAATPEQERDNLNVAILGWCAAHGYTCADTASWADNGSGQLRAEIDEGDGLHLNQNGENDLGTFMAEYLR